jgi:Fe(3+) dicitrate transport protein
MTHARTTVAVRGPGAPGKRFTQTAALLALLAALWPHGQLVGQTTVLRGLIVDEFGAPVRRAAVRFDRAGGDSTRTSDQGRFALRRVSPADTIVRVTAPGFASISHRPAIASASHLRIVLERTAVPLTALSVVGEGHFSAGSVPGATAIVGSEVLRDRAPVSVGDALRTVPGLVTADEDPYGLNLNVGMRGLPARRSSRTLLLEDGVPILLGPYGDPSMHYAPPLELLERIEIVKGAAQVMNGPQTLAGVVNFVTREAPATGREVEATVGGGALGFRNAGLHAGTTAGRTRLSLDVLSREGAGVRLEQHHRISGAMLKGIVPLRVDQRLSLKVGHFREASRIAETGLTQQEFETNPFSLPFAAAGRFDVRRTMLQAVHTALVGGIRVQTNAYATHTRRASWRQSGESGERITAEDFAADFNCAAGARSYAQCGNQGRPRDYTVVGLEPRLSRDFGDAVRGVTVDLGARVLLEQARRRQYLGNMPLSREADAALVRDNSIDTRALATYAQARLRRGPLEVTPAVRIEQIDQQVRNRFPGSESRLSPTHTLLLPGVGTTWRLTPQAQLFTGLHRGFAPPRPADLYNPQPGQAIVLVDPETSWNWEAGARLHARRGASLDVTVFHMNFANEIIEAPALTGQRFVNGGHTVHAGVELSSSLTLLSMLRGRGVHDVVLSGAVMYLPLAERRSATDAAAIGARLPYAPRTAASAALVYRHHAGVSVGTSVEQTGAQFADERNTVAPSADGQAGLLPAYTVVHGFASLQLPRAPLVLRLSVRNAFDRVYITQRNEGIYTGVRRFIRAEVQWRRQGA